MGTQIEINTMPDSWFVSKSNIDAYIPRIDKVPVKLKIVTGEELHLFYSPEERANRIIVEDIGPESTLHGIHVTIFDNQGHSDCIFSLAEEIKNSTIFDFSSSSDGKIGNVAYDATE